jgi:hypothetical protein
MTPARYRYELRNGEDVVATGYLTREDLLEVGDWIEIAGRTGTVRVVEPQLGMAESRLVVQLIAAPHD